MAPHPPPSRSRMATSLSTATPTREPAAAARLAVSLCQDMKAHDVVLLNLKGVTDMTDYFVIASGTSDTHVRAVGEHLISELKKEGVRVHHTEGLQQGRWMPLEWRSAPTRAFHAFWVIRSARRSRSSTSLRAATSGRTTAPAIAV